MRRICIGLCLAGLIVGMNACGRMEKTVDEKAAESYVKGQESDREGLQESEITGGTDNEEVQFECKAIENAVRVQLNKGPEAVIRRQTLEEIEEFSIWFENGDEPACIADDLRYFTNLRALNIYMVECNEEKVLDYTELGTDGALKNLEELLIRDCYLEDISFLGSMNQLTHLWLSDMPIQDTEPIGELTNLVELSLKNCGIDNISFLKNVKNLQSLNLSDNKVEDISLLAQFTQLARIELDRNEITDVSPLISMENLIFVSVYDNPVENLGILVGSVPDFDVSAGSGTRKDTWNDEVKKALLVYDVTAVETEGHLLEIEDYYVGDATGDGIDDVGIVASWTGATGEYREYSREYTLYIYPGTGSSFRPPLTFKDTEMYHQPYDGIILQDGRLIIQCHNDSVDSFSRYTDVYKIKDQTLERVMEIFFDSWQSKTEYEYRVDNYDNKTMNIYVFCIDELYQWHKLKILERVIGSGDTPMDIRTPNARKSVDGRYLYHQEMEELPYSAQDALEIAADEFGCEYERKKVYITNKEIIDSCEKLYGIELPDYYYRMDTPDGIVEIFYYDYVKISEIFCFSYDSYPGEKEKHFFRVCLNGGFYKMYAVGTQSGKIELVYPFEDND